MQRPAGTALDSDSLLGRLQGRGSDRYYIINPRRDTATNSSESRRDP